MLKQVIEGMIDLGSVIEGATVIHHEQIVNSGNNPITILSTGASCGCTKPSIKTGVIMPGEILDLVINFNTTGKKGNNSKSCWVDTNSADKRLTLQFKCEVK